ncbi:MAG: histidine phosphatase family protein [Clostridia bacterium]|nr:histidine phosphatase family protein [Clostridia bacterium]
MKTTYLYLIRHGQSQGNLHDLFLGHTDLDLTPLGHAQAEKTAEFLAAVPVDVIFSSDLKRAYQTALHTAEKKGIAAQPDPRLREIFAGEWEGVPFADLKTRYAPGFEVWLHDFGAARCDGGESVAELKDRIFSAISSIAQENEGKHVCIFTHATPIRLMGSVVKGLSLKEAGTFPWPSNASVTTLAYENGEFALLNYSNDSFMGDMVTRLSDL